MTVFDSFRKYKTFFASTFVLFLAVSSYAGWNIQVVDNPRFFERSSLKFDGPGNPCVAFGGDHLYYAVFSASAWQFQVVDSAPGVGGYCSLAFDLTARPSVTMTARTVT
jgi:hypothetical protein